MAPVPGGCYSDAKHPRSPVIVLGALLAILHSPRPSASCPGARLRGERPGYLAVAYVLRFHFRAQHQAPASTHVLLWRRDCYLQSYGLVRVPIPPHAASIPVLPIEQLTMLLDAITWLLGA